LPAQLSLPLDVVDVVRARADRRRVSIVEVATQLAAGLLESKHTRFHIVAQQAANLASPSKFFVGP
jgi:hypothetical protein